MGWPLKKLDDVCSVVNGGTPKTGVIEYWDGEHQWITPAEMGKLESPFVDQTKRTLTDAGLKKSSANLLPSYSVILSSRAPIGHLVINTVPMATNQGCKGVVPSEEINYNYLYFFLLNNVQLLNDLGSGTTFTELSASKLKSVEIPVPPLTEQKQIVAILDEAFANIDHARQLAERNLKNARELFDSTLNQIFTQRGEGWHSCDLSDYVNFIDYRGKTPKKTESGLRLITAKNVRMGFLRPEPAEFVAPESYDAWMTRGIPQEGDVLFTTEAPLANVAQLDTDEKVVFAQRIIIMQPDRQFLNSTFLKYLLLSASIQKRIHDKGTGATATGIKASLLKKIKIDFPYSVQEQERIIKLLDSISIQSKKLEEIYIQKITALDELKQSLLQKAFRGELTQDQAAA